MKKYLSITAALLFSASAAAASFAPTPGPSGAEIDDFWKVSDFPALSSYLWSDNHPPVEDSDTTITECWWCQYWPPTGPGWPDNAPQTENGPLASYLWSDKVTIPEEAEVIMLSSYLWSD